MTEEERLAAQRAAAICDAYGLQMYVYTALVEAFLDHAEEAVATERVDAAAFFRRHGREQYAKAVEDLEHKKP